MYHIVIDPEYQSLIPPLRPRELEELTQALQRDGCREPLSVMEDVDDDGSVCYVLLDGHNRHQICESLGLPYKMNVIHGLMSREEIRQWIIRNQLARRNLTSEQIAYYRGENYKHQKAEVPNPTGKNQHSEVNGQSVHQPPEQDQSDFGKIEVGGQNVQRLINEAPDSMSGSPCGQNVHQPQENTAERLASVHNVSEKTIRRDAQYAEAVDRLVAFLGPEFRRRLLAHKTGLTKKDVHALASLDDKRLKHIADARMDPKRCARTVRRGKEQNRPLQLEFTFVDTWCARIAEARDALQNGDQDAVETILVELLDQLEKVKSQHASR